MPHVILFVDDEPQVLDLLGMTFPASAGYEPLRAHSGAEALQILESRTVDLVITDQRMPNMSGVELVASAHKRQPDLCVIVLTAYSDPKDLVDAINKGEVYRYITKPWDTADLRQTVVRALEQVDLRREKARLYAELERRLAALSVAVDIARDVGLAGTFEGLMEGLLSRLPSLVPCDLAAALVAPRGSRPVLVVQRPGDGGDEAILRLKSEVIAAWEKQGGARLNESELAIRVSVRSPSRAARLPMRARLIVPLQFAGYAAGLVVLQSADEDAFGEGDARVLDLLANELAESLRVLATKLGEERRRLERTMECMADGLLVAYVESDEVVANPAARRMLHAPEGEPLSIRWLKEALGFHPYDLARGLDTAGSEPAQLADELRVFDRTLSSVVSPVTDAAGRLMGVAVALRDISEQKRLEERKEEFVQVVSHELRTPLTAVTGALDLVLGGLAGGISPKQARFLQMARDSSDKLNAIVDDLLDLARLAKGKMRMELAVTYLDEIAEAAVEKYGAAAAEKGVVLSLDCHERSLKMVADAARLGQVLSNLLTNSIKFTQDNGVVRVSVFRPKAVEGWVGLSIWNNGESIAEADLERIFEQFEQARTDRTRRVKGTGLGLSICRSIVEAHGGCVWADGELSEGARFFVLLPAQPDADGQPAAKPAGSFDAARQAPLALVLDRPEEAAVVRAILLRRGLRVATAHSSERGFALARRLRPRLLVADPRSLPDGADLCAHLSSDPELKRVPLVVFSAAEERAPAFAGGASGFVAKPAQTDEVAGAVSGLLKTSRRTGCRVLVVDDDAAVRSICAEVLGNHGYVVDEADSSGSALRFIQDKHPQVVLIDVMLPDGDGFSMLEKLKDERAANPFAALFISARGQMADKVRGFRLGADDYLTKPFDALDLVTRIDAVLRRRENAVGASATSRLPGGRAVEQEAERRLTAGVPFSFCSLQVDGLDSYGGRYGFAKADGVVLQVGDLLREAVRLHGGESEFVGHLSGGEFVLLAAPERADAVCENVVTTFDKIIPVYYDHEDLDRGYVEIEGEDRAGTRQRHPIVRIVAAVVEARLGRYATYSEIGRAAAEVRKRARAVGGSVYLRDASAENAAKRGA